MRIALIFPPYTHKIFSENLAVVDEEFCVAPPIILAYVASILQAHGHQVILLDARVLNLSKLEALKKIKAFKPDMLGFRAESYHFHDALDWMRYLKQNLNIPVVAGGPNLTLYPKETLSHQVIDYGIIGEAIESLPKLVAALESGDSINKIAGVVYRKDGNVVINNPPAEKYIDFNSYPFPARHLLPNERYYSFISQRKNFTVMVTAIGCPFKCTFCAISHVYRPRTVKNVVDEIEICYRDFNIREIDFFDPVFFIDKNRLLQLFYEIKKRKMDIEWSCRSRVDVVDEEILREAASAGCRQIYYGIESADAQILHAIKKEIGPEEVKQAVKWSKKYGIRTMGFFMVGNQGETKESVLRTIEFAENIGLDFIQVCRTIAKPGTDLDKIMIEKTGKDYWREYILGERIVKRLPTPWSGLSEKEMEALTKKFYLKFYFRPKIVWNRVFQLKSISEFTRYIKVAWRMLLQKSELYSHILTDTTEAEQFLAQGDKYLAEARKQKVAIVIPTYNERDNIKGIITAILDVLPGAEIVVVDDQSPDATGDIVRNIANHNERVHFISRSGERGLGLSYITGFKYVLEHLTVDYIFEMDADFSHNPRYLPLFLHYVRDYELVTGSRFLRRVSIKNRPVWRNIISKVTKWMVNKVTGIKLTDVTTGFKCFRRSLLEKIDLDNIESKGYAFQIEVSYIANQLGANIKEIPILFVERTAGSSKLSTRIMLEGIYLISKVVIRKFRKIKQKDLKLPPVKFHRGRGKLYAIYINRTTKFSNFLFAGGGNFSDIILKMINFEKNKRILDIGCGAGNLLVDIRQRANNMNNRLVVGADYSQEIVKFALTKFRNDESKPFFVICDASHLPFKPGTFDVCFNVLLLHHLPLPLKVQALNEVARILTPDGSCLLMDVDRPTKPLGWLIACLRWHVSPIRDNFRYGLKNFYTQAGLVQEAQIKKMGLFSYYRLRKSNWITK